MENREQSDDGKMNRETHNKKIIIVNFIYVTAILIALVVAILVINEKINDKVIANIATVSSIILSVLAIFITVLANNSTNTLLHKIRDIADDLGGLPQRIQRTIGKLDESTTRLDRLDELTTITRRLCNIEEGLNSYASSLSNMSKRVDGLESNTLNTNSVNPSEAHKIDTQEPNKESVITFLNELPYRGLQFIYSISRFYRESKVFELRDYAPIVEDGAKVKNHNDVSYYDYLFGFYICFRSIPGYITIDAEEKGINNLIIRKIDNNILDNIDRLFDDYSAMNIKFKERLQTLIDNSPSIETIK